MNTTSVLTRLRRGGLLAAALCLLVPETALVAADSASWPLVRSKMRPEAEWRLRPTREPASLPGLLPAAPVQTSRWGGWKDLRIDEGNGYFRVGRSESGRWWLIDPDGYAFIHVGLASVYQGLNDVAMSTTRSKFADTAAWAESALTLLRENGFNGMGGWTERDAFHDRPDALPYTVSVSFLSTFGRQLGITHINPGQTGYINEVPPVFHPDFPAWCDAYAAQVVRPVANDRFLIGFFTDNEIPFRRESLDRSLDLPLDRPEVAPMREHAIAWLTARRGGPGADLSAPPTEEEQIAFLGELTERYHALVGAALRREAPNRLFLGTRLHGRSLRFPEVLSAAGRHVDVLSVNYYHAWAPAPDRMDLWIQESGRPVMITEFYAKGMDTGMENRNGAGWIVPDQDARGRFYQHFTLGLLEHGTVVGWHWFKYRDNEPFDTTVQEGNRDTNKGVIAWDYSPYEDLLSRMRDLHAIVYPVTRYFDSRR